MNNQHIESKKGRLIGSEFSLAIIMFHQAVAEQSGLNIKMLRHYLTFQLT